MPSPLLPAPNRLQKPNFGARVNWSNPLTAGLIRSWVMNEGGGTSLRDGASGYHSTLTTVTTAPAWTTGLYGRGVAFSDQASYANPSGPVVNTAKVTVETLVRYDASPGGAQVPHDIIGFVDGYGSGAQDKILSIYRDGEPAAHAYDGANHDIFGSAQIAIGASSHLALTADGTNLTLYRDGVQVAQIACGDTYTAFTQPNIVIGALASTGSPVTIFAARVWTRALSAAEIGRLAADPWQLYVSPIWRREIVPVVGGTTFTQSLGGTLTSSGIIIRRTNKPLAGTLSSSGAAVKQTNKPLTGVLTSSGTATKKTSKTLTGTLTSSGTLAKIKAAIVSLTGTLTSSGSLIRQTNKPFTGSLSSSGSLIRQTNKSLAGTLTSSGTLAKIKAALVSLAGTLTSSGVIVRRTNKPLAGTLSSSGTLVRQTNKSFAGTLTSSGTLAKIRAVLKSLAGTLTSSGVVVRQPQKSLAGTLTSSGALTRATFRSLTGTLATTGTIAKRLARTLVGTLSSSGTVSTVKSQEGTVSVSGTVGISGSLSIVHTVYHAPAQFVMYTNEITPDDVTYRSRPPSTARLS